MEIDERLIYWYLREGRDLPWRNTRDPYKIWLSEIILQQTRVEQGMSYYETFINTYPTIGLLADAKDDKIMKIWQGLGYYSRARNLLETARYIQNELDGIFPQNYAEIIKLKGVGPYTAAAISSFAFRLPHAVVDGNVSRVLSRVFDVEHAINSSEGKKVIQALADECISKKEPDTYNQAIMELGAMVCKPKNPECHRCPLKSKCLALKNGTVKNRPIKIKGKKARVRHMDYAVLETADHVIFRKREEKDIWQGLHDFAAVEEVNEPQESYMRSFIGREFPDLRIVQIPAAPEKQYTHILSHQKIKARFWRYSVDGFIGENSLYLSIPKNQIEEIAVPRLVHKYLEDVSLV
ncbi:MAG: A/G-specific adenine glycosylase [Cryomorphaceae bacterium]|nr:A/G-specific adenine glycosylase [Flavobacteriales bacterium]